MLLGEGFGARERSKAGAPNLHQAQRRFHRQACETAPSFRKPDPPAKDHIRLR
jgi:hypothetical protein